MLLYLNYYILRWFGIRLAIKVDKDTGKYCGWTFIRRKYNEGWIKE